MQMPETKKEILKRLQATVCGRQDPNNMYPPATDGQKAFEELVRYFMGDVYMNSCVDPISQGQWNTNALCDIELKYRKSLIRIFR